MLISLLAGCGSNLGKTYMSLGSQSLTVNMYELYLSRMKGRLSAYSYPVDMIEFWQTVFDSTGTTYASYFESQIRTQCERTLAALYLFEDVYHLTLSAEAVQEVDSYIEDLMLADAEGSKSAFNAILAQYGVNVDILKEVYLIEAKIEALRSHLSTLIADTVRSEYYTNHYVCFKKIVVSSFKLVCETDENGDDIYYTDSTMSKISYDTENGRIRQDGNGNLYADKFGDTAYYLAEDIEDGVDEPRYAYRTIGAYRNNLDENGDSVGDYVNYTAAEMAERKKTAEAYLEKAKTLDDAAFTDYAMEVSDKFSDSDSGNGAFLNLDVDYSATLLNSIRAALRGSSAGDTIFCETEEGYYVLRVLPLPADGWNAEDNKDWFSQFESEVVDEMYNTLTSKEIPNIQYDEKAAAKLPSIKDVGTNWLGTMYY